MTGPVAAPYPNRLANPALSIGGGTLSDAPMIAARPNVELTLPSAAGPVEILRRLSRSCHRARRDGQRCRALRARARPSMMMVIAGLERAERRTGRGCRRPTSPPLDEDALALLPPARFGGHRVSRPFHLIPTMTALRKRGGAAGAWQGRGDAFERARGDCLESGRPQPSPEPTTPASCRAASSSASPWPAPFAAGTRTCC